jgi:hypothetical protein
MLEKVLINFRCGIGELQVIENDLLVRYRIEVSVDRQIASIVQSKFQKVDALLDSDGVTIGGYVNIGNIGEQVTLDQIRNDPSRTELFRWFAIGVFGIPLQG